MNRSGDRICVDLTKPADRATSTQNSGDRICVDLTMLPDGATSTQNSGDRICVDLTMLPDGATSTQICEALWDELDGGLKERLTPAAVLRSLTLAAGWGAAWGRRPYRRIPPPPGRAPSRADRGAESSPLRHRARSRSLPPVTDLREGQA